MSRRISHQYMCKILHIFLAVLYDLLAYFKKKVFGNSKMSLGELS